MQQIKRLFVIAYAKKLKLLHGELAGVEVEHGTWH